MLIKVVRLRGQIVIKLVRWFALVIGVMLQKLNFGRKPEEGNKMNSIGFTGTRWGMARLQSDKVELLLVNAIEQGIDTGNHGDCKGADVQFHKLCQKYMLRINIHPPTKDEYRAYCKDAFASTLPPKSYLERDRNIVNGVCLMIAAPKSMFDRNKGGTWYTANHAIKEGKKVVIVDPNGVCEYHNFKPDGCKKAIEIKQTVEKYEDSETIRVRVTEIKPEPEPETNLTITPEDLWIEL